MHEPFNRLEVIVDIISAQHPQETSHLVQNEIQNPGSTKSYMILAIPTLPLPRLPQVLCTCCSLKCAFSRGMPGSHPLLPAKYFYLTSSPGHLASSSEFSCLAYNRLTHCLCIIYYSYLSHSNDFFLTSGPSCAEQYGQALTCWLNE